MTRAAIDEPFDRIILGQNQFFGVNHISDRKGVEREKHFGDIRNIQRLLEDAVDLGITGFTISTHPRTPEILGVIRRNPKLRSGLNVYPGIPDPGKLLRMATALGPVGTVKHMLGQTGATKRMAMALSGVSSFMRQDYLGMLKTLMEVELAPFKGLNVRGVFLANNLNDLGLGLDVKEVFVTYYEYLAEKVGVVPAFNTTILPLHLRKMKEYGLPNLPVMAAINKNGFYVNPSIEAFCEAAREHQARIVAMSVLSSGLLRPAEALDFVFETPRIESITVGASTRAHLEGIVGEVGKHSEKFSAVPTDR